MGNNTVEVVNIWTNTVVDAFDVGAAPYGVAVNSLKSQVYVATVGTTSAYVIDTSTKTVTEVFGVGANQYSIAVAPGRHLRAGASTTGRVASNGRVRSFCLS